jgi:hypothetical protein
MRLSVRMTGLFMGVVLWSAVDGRRVCGPNAFRCRDGKGCVAGKFGLLKSMKGFGIMVFFSSGRL